MRHYGSVNDYYSGCYHELFFDLGVIQPTAAISSIPFMPKESMDALRYFYEEMGEKLWSKYGFVDGFNIHHNWYAKSHLAIDQGPIIVMIENYPLRLVVEIIHEYS